jgi:nitrate/nitrite transport system ATP-binding protein
MSNPQPALELNHVHKSFHGKCVLHDLNLAIQPGEFVSILGYSGSGKTTLLSLLAGLIKPDAGEVKQDGTNVLSPGPERGVVFQNYSLLPWLTVGENVALAVSSVYRHYCARQRQDHVMHYVNMVKLGSAVHKLPRQLSGGMRQRVSLARGLAMDPKVLLLDEPLAALDALTRAVLQEEISAIWQETKKTVVWITNDPDEAILLADRILPLTPGPSATLGPDFIVPLSRPRDRRDLLEDPTFIALRADLVNWLLTAKNRESNAQTKKFILPDILPEDLTTTNTLQFLNRKGPKRRSAEREETKEIRN